PSFLRNCAEVDLQVLPQEDHSRSTWTDWPRFWIAAIPIVVGVCILVSFRLNAPLRDDPSVWDTRLSLALGMASALAISHFAGRMDSKFILNWQWVVVMLFLY